MRFFEGEKGLPEVRFDSRLNEKIHPSAWNCKRSSVPSATGACGEQKMLWVAQAKVNARKNHLYLSGVFTCSGRMPIAIKRARTRRGIFVRSRSRTSHGRRVGFGLKRPPPAR